MIAALPASSVLCVARVQIADLAHDGQGWNRLFAPVALLATALSRDDMRWGGRRKCDLQRPFARGVLERNPGVCVAHDDDGIGMTEAVVPTGGYQRESRFQRGQELRAG